MTIMILPPAVADSQGLQKNDEVSASTLFRISFHSPHDHTLGGFFNPEVHSQTPNQSWRRHIIEGESFAIQI
jgi:hypothetical protein